MEGRGVGAEGLGGEGQVLLGGSADLGTGLRFAHHVVTALIASGTILQLLFAHAPDPRALAILELGFF